MGQEIVEYDIYEPDLDLLYRTIKENAIRECLVYGTGNNGLYFSKCLKANGVNIKYYVDLQAKDRSDFMSKDVIAPQDLKRRYAGEYILVSPNRFDSIVSFLVQSGISKDKIILPFYLREKINVDYGSEDNKASDEIDYCHERPDNPEVTVASIIYNTEEYLLRRAIESILKQKYRNFIYVIIINGATDRSYEIAKEYESLDSRIEIINLEKNFVWTDINLLNEIKNHLYGQYWCQIDGDDYYGESFLERTLSIAWENNADMVAVRTMAIAADKEYDLMKTDKSFDGKDKFWFYHGDPACHAFGQNHIMEELAWGKISGTWWGKLWSMQVTKAYFAFLLALSEEIRGCYFRLDTAMTYKMLTLCNRVYFCDKVLHYQSFSPGRTTYSDAPVEWLMSLWFVYRNIKISFFAWYDYDTAMKFVVKFLGVFVPWMIGRKGLLNNVEQSPYRKIVLKNLKELYSDEIFMDFITEKMGDEVQYGNFFRNLSDLVGEKKKSAEYSIAKLDDGCDYGRIIGYGAKGKNARKLIPRLMDTPYFPTELWDVNGDGNLIKKPDIESLDERDLVLIFPTNAAAVESIKKSLCKCNSNIVWNESISHWLFENQR